MIESLVLRNFKALRSTQISLPPFTLILGPNGSGKSTLLQALESASRPDQTNYQQIVSVGANPAGSNVEVEIRWGKPFEGYISSCHWSANQQRGTRTHKMADGTAPQAPTISRIETALPTFRFYSFDPEAIAQEYQITPQAQLGRKGEFFVAILDRLKDEEPERFDALNDEFCRWLSEYDHIILRNTNTGMKSFFLRTVRDKHLIPAFQLSQGTLLSLALLTLTYLPSPPALIGLEEPDRGLHPRLLRDLRDSFYRLAYPESVREVRGPVQVVVTSHSPYLLDLFRDHPEEVVLAQKEAFTVRFQRLSEYPRFEEILGDAPLSEMWYSGILGGVPASP